MKIEIGSYWRPKANRNRSHIWKITYVSDECVGGKDHDGLGGFGGCPLKAFTENYEPLGRLEELVLFGEVNGD